jgi:hypothetical protein
VPPGDKKSIGEKKDTDVESSIEIAQVFSSFGSQKVSFYVIKGEHSELWNFAISKRGTYNSSIQQSILAKAHHQDPSKTHFRNTTIF